MKKKLLLQVKFFVVAFLNVTYNFVPNPLRRYYLRLFGIRFDKNGKNYIHRRCKFFHVGNLIVGHNSCINFDDTDILAKIAGTAMTGKNAEASKEKLCDLIVRAITL
ncbi:MAG: hypothetical protein IIW13_04365, partial [Paludibacteraceae bacterium]|nr:hypothetical protein [Paludibacteraceae bacterium]